MNWQPWSTAPRDGRWIVALCNDRQTVHRVSWGRNQRGELRWCTAENSFHSGYGDGLFRFWIDWPGEADESAEEDGGADLTTPEILKPRGNNGVADMEICLSALLLVGDTDVDEAIVTSWTQAQRDQAYDWAMRVHFRASDNDDVFVPERPDFVPYPRTRGFAL